MNVNIPAKFGASIKNRIILRLQVAGLRCQERKRIYTRESHANVTCPRVLPSFSLFYNICLLVVCEILKSRNKTTPKYTAFQEFITR